MSSTDPTVLAMEHCETMSNAYPELREMYYEKIASSCQQKLWHQLTVTTLEFVRDDNNHLRLLSPSSSSNNNFLALYEQVIIRFENKLHPLSTARIAVAVSNTLINNNSNNNTVDNIASAKTLLENLIGIYQQKLIQNQESVHHSSYRKKKDTSLTYQEAILYLQSKLHLITLYSMMTHNSSGTSSSTAENTTTTTTTKEQVLADILKSMKKNASILQEWAASHNVTKNTSTITQPGVMTDSAIVHAAHYEQSMTYYKLVGPPEAFYEQAMQFITYSPPPSATSTSTSTTVVDKFGIINYHQLAIDICLAALTGDGVYNLGQVEQTPCLSLLHNTNEYWLVELLMAVSYGKVVEFHNLTSKYATQISQQPALMNRSNAVEEKLTLMALLELIVIESKNQAIQRAADHSTPANTTGSTGPSASQHTLLTLQDIAAALHRPIEQVEWVIMRACSVNLLIATIDQVDGTVAVEWVMPRVLNSTQMMELAHRFQVWANHVTNMESYMKEHTQTLFA